MGQRDWLWPPRHLILLFVLVTLVPSLALVGSRWRLLEQDRALSLTQLAERREQAADLAVSELERSVAAIEQSLRDEYAFRSAAAGADDVVGVRFEDERAETFPTGRLMFYPRTESGIEAPASRFADGEYLEFQQHALPAAIDVYRGLARLPDASVRAGALIRRARVLPTTGENEKALDMYAEVAKLSGVSVSGESQRSCTAQMTPSWGGLQTGRGCCSAAIGQVHGACGPSRLRMGHRKGHLSCSNPISGRVFRWV